MLTREERSEYAKQFYKDYRDEPEEEAKAFAYQQRTTFAHALMEKISIKVNDLEDIAALLKEALKYEPTARVDVHGDEIHSHK